MRKIAVEELGKYKSFRAIDGTAAETKLDGRSVDYITTAQAFHRFDISSFIKECIRIKHFFEDKYEYVEFDNPLFYDKNKLISRSLSGSYSLKNGDENYSEYLDTLSDLFEKYSKDNVLTMANKTVAYIGRI